MVKMVQRHREKAKCHQYTSFKNEGNCSIINFRKFSLNSDSKTSFHVLSTEP